VLRRRALMVGAALCATAALVLPASAGYATRAVAEPGAPGVGDDYYPGYGNGGYDVSHYDIRLKYTPSSDQLRGSATLLARPTQDLTSFNLDFALNASSVRVNGAKAAFSRKGIELTVTPVRPLRTGQFTTIVVEYAGVPSQVVVDGYTAWFRTADGAVAAGEPEIAAWWFPSNDHPTDKATFDISVLVPRATEVISNGVLTRRQDEPLGTRWGWRSAKPTATYLAFLAIGQYELVSDTAPNGQPVVNAYADNLGEHAGSAKASIERTTEINEWLSEKVGPYPFEAQGGVVLSANIGFALETQTRPVYSPRSFRGGANNYLVVHELAHQWFGDSVSVAKWRNIWLNEGFASYAEWLWSEDQGEGTAQEVFDFTYDSYPADDPFWQVMPGDPGASTLFHGAVYDRGAMTLHALRTAVGDEAFYQMLRTWTADKKYTHATIDEFIALAERISGKQLDALFQTWLFTKGRPAVSAATGVKASAATTPIKEPKSIAKIKRAHETAH
jgi:aminopeptidase N